MNAPAQPSEWDRTTTAHVFRWLLRWRVLRWVLIALAWLATLIALFYAEEDWRGRHAWNTYRHQLEARGEQLDFKAFIPPPIPDDQNFAAVPAVKAWFQRAGAASSSELWYTTDDYARAEKVVQRFTADANTPDGKPELSSSAGGSKSGRHVTDLAAWAAAFNVLPSAATGSQQPPPSAPLGSAARSEAAAVVLNGLKTNDALFAEFRAVSHRPQSRYPIVYDLDNPWGILLPHLASVKAVCIRLQLRACAELAAGRSDDALADVTLVLRMADSFKDEPILISYLVRLACVHLAVQPVWEGLAAHAWSDAQLVELQKRFQEYDFLADAARAFAAERTAGILTVDLLAKGKYRLDNLGGDPTEGASGGHPAAVDILARIMPSGWYGFERVNYCRLFDDQLEGAMDAKKHRVSPGDVRNGQQVLAQELPGFTLDGLFQHRLVAGILLPALGRITAKAAAAQIAADQAALACALERYRLAEGQFPESLDALAPLFVARLPHDVIGGEAYKYRRTDDGQFVLYSIGWNEKDDGGVPGKRQFDEETGDWVWRFPGK